MLQAKDYQEYINKFIELVKTDYMCFDIYPFYNNSIIEPTYINNLNIIGKACRNNNRDMWVYIQTQGNWLNYTLPTEKQIKWQAYSSLSFGAKAILHVSYTPVWNWSGEETIGMLDKNGNKTNQWYAAKNVNDELNTISNQYMQYKNIGTLGFGNFQNSKMNTQLSELNNDNENDGISKSDFNYVISKVDSNQAVLLGYFQHKTIKNKKAFTLVNMQDPTNDNSNSEVEILIPNAKSVIAYENGRPIQKSSNNGFYNFHLESGDGVFVTVELDENIKDGWYNDSNGNTYYYENYKTTKGWKLINNQWFYFDVNSGIMKTSWQNHIPGWEEQWFYFDVDSGIMKTGWQNNIPGWDGQWFYFDNNTGVMKVV